MFERELAPMATEALQFEFPAPSDYAHDLIDPEGQNAEDIDAIYDKLWPYLGLEQR